jgi:hypothetical protein
LFVAFVGAWLLMFALALVHHDVPAVPPLGFRASFGAVLALEVVGHAVRGVGRKDG